MAPTGPPTAPPRGGPLSRPGLVRRPWLMFALGALAGALVASTLSVALTRRGSEPALEPGELRILSGSDDSVGRQREALIEVWNAAHPSNPARIVPLNERSDAQHAEMVNRAQNDHEIDIFNLDVTWTAEFASERWLRPIDESLLSEEPDSVFLANPLATCRYDGQLWALPFNTDAGLLFYRTDLGLQPPFDWPKITTEADRVLAGRPSGSSLQAGYTGQFADYEGLVVNALEALWSAGGTIGVDDEGTVSVDPRLWTEALRRLTPGGRTGDGTPLVHPEAREHDETRSREVFRSGRVMFMRNWPVQYRSLSAGDTAPASPTATPSGPALEFDVAALPGPSVLGGQNLAIARQTGQPRAAQALIGFLTGEESQRRLFQRGGFAATRATVYQDATVRQEYPYAALLRAEIDRARRRPESPHYPTFSLVLRRYVIAVLNGGDMPADLAQRLTDALAGKLPHPAATPSAGG